MNKLGFAIKLASQGAGNAIECNKGQWTSKVVDIREYLKLFNGLQGTDNIVTFMSFDENGCFLTQLRAISGRIGDFLSGWIYIPNTIEATGEDIMNAYNYVRNILSQSNLNDSIEEIKAFFSKEYPKREYAVQNVPSSGEEFGVRFVDVFYSMKEILDANRRYQPYYSKYKAVFLLDKHSEVKIVKGQEARFKDLTKKAIDETCVFKAPSQEEVRRLGRGTKIVFDTKQEFKSPVLTKKGDTVQLYALRDGFEDIALPIVTIQEDGQTCSIDPKEVKWKKRISFSMFAVYDHKHEKIKNGVQICINGKNITNQGTLILEDDCRQATVKVSAPDYETFEQKMNLINENYNVILSRKVRSYNTTVELANGYHAVMTLESRFLPSPNESPLKGYSYNENSHGEILKMDFWFVWKQRLYGFFAALAVVVLVIAYNEFSAWYDTHRLKWGIPPWEEIPAQDQPQGTLSEANDSIAYNQDGSVQPDTIAPSLDEAIKYLDNNSIWSRSEMEKYPDLKGLFDDMNNFKLQRIVTEWNTKLLDSQKFNEVYNSARKALTRGWNPEQEPHHPYNKLNDKQIFLKNYIDKLNTFCNTTGGTTTTVN